MSFSGPKIWNKLSSNIKTAATTASFTHHLKTEILDKLRQGATSLISFVDLFIFFYNSLFFLLYFFPFIPLGGP